MEEVSGIRAGLGEGPVWSAEEGVVYWVDIPGKALHRTDPATRLTDSWPMPSHPGNVALRKSGGLVVALEDGLYSFDTGTETLSRLVAIEDDIADNRPNDGKCDAEGRLWFGTMNKVDGTRPSGRFYKVDTDLTVTEIADGIEIPNGLAWSPDDRVMYHTDTHANMVSAYAFDLVRGERGARHDFFPFDRQKIGGVDGAAVDVEGGYWTVLFRGAKLIRILPDGRVDREIALPVSQPTMPAFGGADLKTLYITSATEGLEEPALDAQPHAGGLLAVAVDVAGCPVHAFGG